MRKIGIMQGRLSPPRERLQAFPQASWEREFGLAARLGFDTLEWVLETDRIESNPLLAGAGRERIRELTADTGVEVLTVCANYFMDHRLSTADEAARQAHVRTLCDWLPLAAEIGVQVFMLPILERAEVQTDADRAALLGSLREPLARARDLGLRVALETELPAREFTSLIDEADDSTLGAYFDCGNAAAQGYDPAADLAGLGCRVIGIHLKDRPRDGGNVPLGEGAIDFPQFMEAVEASPYSGPLVLETTPGDDPIAFATRHAQFVRALLPPR